MVEPRPEEADDGLADFCRDLYPRLVAALATRLGDPEAARDIAQETLVRAWAHWPSKRRFESPAGWCFRVAFNLASSRRRRLAVERRTLAIIGNRAAAITTHDDPGAAVEAVALRGALAKLPAQQRDVLLLRFVADLSVVDTAAALGMKPGTVKSATSRALDALRAHAEDGDDS